MSNNISFIQPKDAWDALSIPEKAEMMRVAVSHGIYNLKDIRQKYNEFALGGDTEEASVSPNEAARMGAMVGAAIASRPKSYIGGSTTEARKKYWQTDNEMKLLTDSVANQYGISPDLLRTRMDNEGYTDARINEINKDVQAGTNRALMGTALFNSEAMPYVAGSEFGLDDVADYINNGTVSLINENWGDGQFRNEQGRWTHMAMGHNYSDNVGIMAATLKALKNIARKDFPSASDADLERYASAYYNRGIEGGRKWAKRGAKGYKVNKHSEGGNLFDGTAQPSQQMQIGLNVQGWPNYTTEQLVAYGEENERRRNAIQDAYLNFITESNDATAVANGRPQNQHLVDRAIQGAKAHATWEKEHPNLTSWGNVLGAAPFVIASIPAVAGAAALGNAGAATSTGKAVTAALAPAYSAVTSSSIGGAPLLTWADAGLRSTMLTQGLEDLIKGEFTPKTAIELSPAAPAIIRTPGIIRNLQPQEIRNHLYVSKAPVGYEGMGDAIDRWTKGILSGKKANIENPWWLGNSDASIAKQALIKEYAPIPSGIQGTEREQFLEKWSDHALKARTDAWRMHNLIPQKYNTFTPSARYPGAWTDEEGINMLKWMPAQVEGQAQGDFVSSVGGNIGIPTITRLGNGIPDTGTQLKRFGVTTTSDWFDLQPMSRPNDRLISRLQRYWGSTASPRISKVAKKIKDVSDGLRYDSKEIDSWMAANRDDEYAMEMFDPDMFPQSGIKRMIGDGLFGLSKKVAKAGSTPSFKFLKGLDERLAKMEVGDVTGGKPFLIQYDIPWTANTKFLDTGGISTEIVPGFQSESILPQSVFDWRNGVVRNIEQPNLQFNPGDIDLLNLRLTTKSKKR